METGKRRIDRILGPGFAEDLASLPLDEVRRRRVERLVADASISGPAELSDEDLDAALERLREEERRISDSRTAVMEIHDRLQDELKRRYKEDPSQALSG